MRKPVFIAFGCRAACIAALVFGILGSGCKEGGSAVLRNLSSENLRVQIVFVKMESADYQASGCPIVGFSLLPNEAVGTAQAVSKAREISMQEYLYDLKQCAVTLDLPKGYSLETGQFGKGESMVEAKTILIRSASKSVSFQKLDFGFRKIDPNQNIYVWDYGWGS